MEWLVPIAVAFIGGPLVIVVQSHAEARTLLREVSAKVDKVDTKLDGHITWHLETK